MVEEKMNCDSIIEGGTVLLHPEKNIDVSSKLPIL